MEKSGEKAGARVPGDTEIIVAFDGSKVRHKDNQGVVFIDPATIRDDMQYYTQDYLRNIGRMLPDPFNAANSRTADRFPDAFALGGYVVQPRLVALDGAWCVLITRSGESDAERLWLDPQVGYAVRQREILSAKTEILTYRYHNQEFVEFGPGVWLPRLCWWELCGPSSVPAPYTGVPLIRYVYSVKKLALNDVADSRFELDLQPGAHVADETVLPGDSLFYTWPANAEQMDQTIRDALVARRQAEFKQRWIRALVWGNIGLAVLLAVVFTRRWYLRRKPLGKTLPSSP